MSQNITQIASNRQDVERVLAVLEHTFKLQEYKPDTSKDVIMYNQGQQSVLNFIRRQLLGT